MIRVHGDVKRINLPPMEHKEVHAMVYDIMSDNGQGVPARQPELPADIVEQGAGVAVHRQRLLRVVAGVGNAHEAAQLQPRQGHDGACQRQHCIGRHAVLGGPAVHVHLQADLQRRARLGTLAVQALGQLRAVQTLEPVEVGGHQRGLATLQRTDAVPLQPRARSASILATPSWT